MTEKWTPGPWRYKPREARQIRSASGLYVGQIYRSKSAKADGHLIAAAPDMADYIKRRAEDGDAEAQELWERACGEDV